MAIEFTDQNFELEVLQPDQVVLVDFWAEWCGPCRMVAPFIDQLSTEYEGKAKIGKLDIDTNDKIPEEYGVKSIPTLLFFKNGKMVDKVVGVMPKEKLAEKLEALL